MSKTTKTKMKKVDKPKVRWKDQGRTLPIESKEEEVHEDVFVVARAMREHNVFAFSISSSELLRSEYGLSFNRVAEVSPAARRLNPPPWASNSRATVRLEFLKPGQWFENELGETGVVLSQHDGMRTRIRLVGSGELDVASGSLACRINEPLHKGTVAPDSTLSKDKPKQESKNPIRKRQTLLGFPATSVVRWMGKNGWQFEEAQQVIRALECPIADATIRIQLRAGEKGERGAPANLSKKDCKKLKDLAK